MSGVENILRIYNRLNCLDIINVIIKIIKNVFLIYMNI